MEDYYLRNKCLDTIHGLVLNFKVTKERGFKKWIKTILKKETKTGSTNIPKSLWAAVHVHTSNTVSAKTDVGDCPKHHY